MAESMLDLGNSRPDAAAATMHKLTDDGMPDEQIIAWAVAWLCYMSERDEVSTSADDTKYSRPVFEGNPRRPECVELPSAVATRYRPTSTEGNPKRQVPQD